MKLVAPFCMARTALSTVPYAVIMITARRGSRLRISARISSPLRSGSAKSSRTRSKGWSANRASPSSPVSAASTEKPSNSSKVSSDSRIAASSSMIRTEPPVVGAADCRVRTAASDIYGLPNEGEFKVESGALPGEALHPDLSSVFLDDPVGHRETQTGASRLAFTRRTLRSEEGIIDLVDVLGSDAGAGIADADLYSGPVGGIDAQRAAAAGHGIFGIHEKVQEHLLQFAGVAM